MAEVLVRTRDGSERRVSAENGRPLMEALRDARLGVEGICGGECACGTCHVYVGHSWLEGLPPKNEDERMMLEAIGEIIEVRAESRLSCQIVMNESLAGFSVEIGPVP